MISGHSVHNYLHTMQDTSEIIFHRHAVCSCMLMYIPALYIYHVRGETIEKESEIVAPRSPVQSHGGLHDCRKLERVHDKSFSPEFGIDRLCVCVYMHGSLSAHQPVFS